MCEQGAIRSFDFCEVGCRRLAFERCPSSPLVEKKNVDVVTKKKKKKVTSGLRIINIE